jgi:hypothetical protein
MDNNIVPETNTMAQIASETVAKKEYAKKSYEVIEKENYYLHKKNRNRRTNLYNLQRAYDTMLRNYDLMQKQAHDWQAEAMYKDRLYRDAYDTLKGIPVYTPPTKSWWQFWN